MIGDILDINGSLLIDADKVVIGMTDSRHKFIQSLRQAILAADRTNIDLIYKNFREYWDKYLCRYGQMVLTDGESIGETKEKKEENGEKETAKTESEKTEFIKLFFDGITLCDVGSYIDTKQYDELFEFAVMSLAKKKLVDTIDFMIESGMGLPESLDYTSSKMVNAFHVLMTQNE